VGGGWCGEGRAPGEAGADEAVHMAAEYGFHLRVPLQPAFQQGGTAAVDGIHAGNADREGRVMQGQQGTLLRRAVGVQPGQGIRRDLSVLMAGHQAVEQQQGAVREIPTLVAGTASPGLLRKGCA